MRWTAGAPLAPSEVQESGKPLVTRSLFPGTRCCFCPGSVMQVYIKVVNIGKQSIKSLWVYLACRLGCQS